MLIINGKEYARVTEILAQFSDYSHIDPQVLRRKCDIGTSVHAAIADHLLGQFPMPCDNGLGYFDSYMKWHKAVAPIVIHTEQRYLCDELMITGQIDLVANVGNIPMLIDFKTSANESKEVWPMQAHLYSYLLEKSGVLISKRFLFVKLDKKGELPMVFTYNFDKNIHAKCMKSVSDFWKKNKR
jgi:ATP-dependent exoDNAse (exonuclease V) beta subunit